MRFPVDDFQYFTSNKVKEVFGKTNELVDILLKDLIDIKREMGELKGILNATLLASQKDINDFLKMAGINYEIVIKGGDEDNSKTILRQLYSENPTEVSNIKKHLSWGEKNAFALILFMYWAARKDPDLIILDDPISSFDSNKKYALMHRLFLNSDDKKIVSLYDKTVLLLTHDFEPITDFVVVQKANPEKIYATYIWNRSGELKEKVINRDDDIIMIRKECEEIARDSAANRVARVVFLRKLCELNQLNDSWEKVYQILSSLIHGEPISRKRGGRYENMPSEEISEGCALIREYISDFDFSNELKDSFNKSSVINLYRNETNGYYKMLLFRELTELCPNYRLQPSDEGWFKYIDETYHIENDSLHYLDVRKFEVVPDYIIDIVDDLVLHNEDAMAK